MRLIEVVEDYGGIGLASIQEIDRRIDMAVVLDSGLPGGPTDDGQPTHFGGRYEISHAALPSRECMPNAPRPKATIERASGCLRMAEGLPNHAAMRVDHRAAGRNLEGFLKLRQVRERAVHAVEVRCVRVDRDAQTSRCGTYVARPEVRGAQEELLVRRESVDGLGVFV